VFVLQYGPDKMISEQKKTAQFGFMRMLERAGAGGTYVE